MALDNANFISELSIVDPPGTDPLSQGDDQIRTVKRATQQSFPNISAAVTLTDVQMNLAAIKNEANSFTAINTFEQDIKLNVNTAGDTFRSIFFTLNSLSAWTQGIQLSTGNYEISRFDVLGAFIDTPVRIAFATGVVDFLNVPTVLGAPLWIAGEIRMFVAAATPGTNWFIADGLNGTVNLDNRVIIGEGSSSPGTLLNPNIVGLLSASASGATAITESQMPSHRHLMAEKSTSGGIVQENPAVFMSACQGMAGVVGSTGATRNADLTQQGRPIVQNTGGGTGHTHTIAQGVVENGTSRDTVRSLSAVVQYHQYVP